MIKNFFHSLKLWRKVQVWGVICATLLLLPVFGNSQQSPVPESKLIEVWQIAYEAYNRNDCVRFVHEAGRYYGLIMYAKRSWNTAEIWYANNYCIGKLDRALQERDRLQKENAVLRRKLSSGSTSSHTSGLTQAPPALKRIPPHHDVNLP